MASKLDRLRCCSCQSLPTPLPDYEHTDTPFVYHCDDGHIACIKCIPSPSAQDDDNEQVKSDFNVRQFKSFPCSQCPLPMHSCRISSVLISRMLLECVHRFSGCMISLNVSNYDTHDCSHSSYPCLFCKVVSESVTQLRTHLDEYHPTIKRNSIVPGKEFPFHMSLDDKILLQHKQDLFVLRFEKGYLFLQVWDKHRRHLLHFYPDDEGDDYLRYEGNTSKVNDKTPVIESLKVPLNFYQDKSIACSLEIDEAPEDENQVMATVIGLTDQELKDMQCQICYNRVRPPLIHCVYDHLLCMKCLKDVVDRNIGKGVCFICCQKLIFCDLGNYILTNSQFSCRNQTSKCDRIDLRYAETMQHEIECSKPFSCPLCLTLFFTTVEELKEHLESVHVDETKGIKAEEESEIVVTSGCNLVREVGGLRDYFLVVYEDRKVCVQHLDKATPRLYYVSVTVVDKGEILSWTQGTLTTQVKKKPTLSDEYILLPPASASNEYMAVIILNINVSRDHEPQP